MQDVALPLFGSSPQEVTADESDEAAKSAPPWRTKSRRLRGDAVIDVSGPQGTNTNSGLFSRAQTRSSIRSRNSVVRRRVGGSPARASCSRSSWMRVASGLRWFDHETRREGV